MKLDLKILVAAIILCWVNQANASVLINEVMLDPSVVDDADGEWFELYNDGDTDVDINGWIVKDANTSGHQINNGGSLIVPAYGYLVLGRNGNPALNGGYIPDYVYSFTLANNEDEIILKDGDVEKARIDYIVDWPIEAGRSMAYSGSGDVNDHNNWFATPEESDYIFGAGDYGTPGEPNMIPEPVSLFLVSSGLLPFLIKRKEGSR